MSQLGVPDHMLEEPERYCDHARNCDCRACERIRDAERDQWRAAVADFIDHEGTDPRAY